MLFELRTSVPDVSDPWVETRDSFFSGKVRRARDLARSLRGVAQLACANDYLLNVEIARACSLNSTYMALVRRAVVDFPDDAIVQLYHARVLLTRSMQTDGIQYLLSLESTLGRTHRALWGTELANLYANAGFAQSCKKWMNAVRDEPGIDSPLALYTQSCAHESLQQWDEAIDFARRCVEAAPNWARARAYYTNCLLARGQIDAARRELVEASRRGHEEAYIDIANAMLPMSLGEFHLAQTSLRKILHDWPDSDFSTWIKRTLCILLVELGKHAEARELANGQEEKLGLPKIRDGACGGHCYIPLPLVAQNRNQCVPTSIAMSVHPQGGVFDPNAMYREMHGADGTYLWRMREWCEQHGYRVMPIRLEKEAVVYLLNGGIPLIGVIEGLFTNHVDVVCGYNDDLDTLYVRDPGHWAPISYPWEMALGRYRLNAGLIAVIATDRKDLLDEGERWKSVELSALMDLSQAIAEGNRTAAEEAYAKIADDSPAASLRDNQAVNVVISPNQYVNRMRSLVNDKTADVISRFRAMLSLGSDEDHAMIAELEETKSQQFGAHAHRFLQLRRVMNSGDWPESLRLVDLLLVRGCGVARFWELKSDILAEMGQHEASNQALDSAIELEPLRMPMREKRLKRSATRLTLAQYVSEFEQISTLNPDDKGTLISRAKVLEDGPDGREFEQVVQQAIRWFPRIPFLYQNLLNWYRLQGRADLVDQLLTQARALLPEDFPESVAQESKPAEPSEPAANAELPENHNELLNLVWQLGEPRRTAALERAIELQGSGQFTWYQTARLVACRLLYADRDGENPSDATAILPDTPPGAPQWFADLVCDLVTDDNPSIATALAVDSWLLRIVPNVAEFPELWFKRVLLLEKAQRMEKALEELRLLLERYPASSSALYRMGVVKNRQQDYPAAREYFQKALEVNPGLFGALQMLREVHQTLDDAAQAIAMTRQLRRKYPYSLSYLSDEALAVPAVESLAAAEKLLDEAAADFPARRLTTLRARLYLEQNRTDDAAELMSNIAATSDDDDDVFEEILKVKLQIAQARKDPTEIISICDCGLARWSDSTRIKEIKAEQLADVDRAASLNLLREVLCHGQPTSQTARQYLNLAPESPNDSARQAIQSAPATQREGLAETFADVMGQIQFQRWNESFLKWAMKEFPQSNQLVYQMILHYSSLEMMSQAVAYARNLYERVPDNPEAARILGRCLIDHDRKLALPYLEQACEQNRSVEYLFDLARCLHVNGHNQKAVELHWEILAHNPYCSASWTNLYVLDGSRERLWPFLKPMLDRGCGAWDQYFHVAAVKIALDLNEKVSPSWFPGAMERWAILRTYPGFKDEQQRLKQSLLVWKTRRPSDVRNDMKPPHDFMGAVVARLWWPRATWVA